MQSKVDIVVVGAGPAGSIAAREAAKNDADVLLIERKKEIGVPVQCAEFIPRLLLEKGSVSTNCIAQDIIEMHVFLPDGTIEKSNSPGFTIHRDLFDKEATSQAVSEGAVLKTDATAIKRNDDHIIIEEAGEQKSVQAEIIIGADGPCSTVGQWINSMNAEFLITRQYTVPLIDSMKHTEIYFRKEWFGGYGWIFPKKSYAHVGIGIKPHPAWICSSLKNLLDDFLSELDQDGIIKKNPQYRTGGLIPVGGPLDCVNEKMALVGDAAGQTHPITGGGVPQAAICGKILGKMAAETIQKQCSMLDEYDEKWRLIFEDELLRARKRRWYLESQWDKLDMIIRRCWPGFPEYYEN